MISRLYLPALGGALIAVSILFQSLPAGGQDAGILARTPEEASAIQSDARLDRRVTLRLTGVEVNELLAQLGDKTVKLRAAEECAGQKVQLNLRNRTLREVMDALSTLLPGYWMVTPGGYLLRMHVSVVSQRKEWWDLFNRIRDAAFAARQETTLALMRKVPRKPDPNHPVESGSALGYKMAMQASAVFGSLPTVLQETIARQTNDFTEYTGYYAWDVVEAGVTTPLNSLPPGARTALLADTRRYLDALNVTPDQTTAMFMNLGSVINTSLLTPNGSTIPTSITLNVFATSPETTVFGLEQGGVPDEVRRLGKSAPPLWRRLAEFQMRRVWPNDPPQRRIATSAPMRLKDCLDRLHEKAGIEYLADCYYGRCGLLSDEEKGKPLMTLKAELDNMADATDTSWKLKSNNLYIFRNNRWYRDDYIQVPNRTLRKIEADTRKYHIDLGVQSAKLPSPDAPGLSEQARWDANVLGALNPWQISRGLAWATVESELPAKAGEHNSTATFPFSRIADRLMRERHTMLFYTMLRQDQRQALLDGRLQLDDMSSNQVAHALFINPGLRSQDVSTTTIGLRPMKENGRILTLSPTIGAQDARAALNIIRLNTID